VSWSVVYKAHDYDFFLQSMCGYTGAVTRTIGAVFRRLEAPLGRSIGVIFCTTEAPLGRLIGVIFCITEAPLGA
jgi:hypothetical protein